MRRRTKMTPAKILDPQRFTWIKPEATNVLKRWESLGWIRPSKNPLITEKWAYYKSI